MRGPKRRPFSTTDADRRARFPVPIHSARRCVAFGRRAGVFAASGLMVREAHGRSKCGSAPPHHRAARSGWVRLRRKRHPRKGAASCPGGLICRVGVRSRQGRSAVAAKTCVREEIVCSIVPIVGLGCGRKRYGTIFLRGPMETLMLPFSPRFIVLTICAVVTGLLLGIGIVGSQGIRSGLDPDAHLRGADALGIRDLTQKSHAVLRNYPISAHMRFLLEEIRPEMRQYFFESEKDGMPFSRDTRAVVYQRAKMVLDKRPFGTQEDVYREGYEWMHHSVAPKRHGDGEFRITSAARIAPSRIRRRFQHLGDEFRRAQPQCGARAERRRQERRLRPRHRRGRPQSLSSREWRRHHLGDRLRLFRLPQPRRHLQPGRNSPASPPTTRSRWSNSRSARAPSPGMAACCRRPRCRRKYPEIRGVAMGEDCISPARIARSRRRSR